MVDVIVVVDPQNSYCKKGGIGFEKGDAREQRGVEAAIKTLAEFLREPLIAKLPRIYFLSNMGRRGAKIPLWQVAIVDDINPFRGAIFHRINPDSDPFDFGCNAFLSVCKQPRLILCGFYGDQCVFRTALCAIKRKIPIVFLTDCTYPVFDRTLQETFKHHAQKRYGILPPLLFLTSKEYRARASLRLKENRVSI